MSLELINASMSFLCIGMLVLSLVMAKVHFSVQKYTDSSWPNENITTSKYVVDK